MRRLLILLFLLIALPGFSRSYVTDSTWRDGVTLDTNDYIALPSSVTLASTTWTAEAWVKVSTSPVVATQTIFSTQTGRMDCLIDSTNSIAMYDGSTYFRAASYPAGISWKHLVFSPSESSITVDGVTANTAAITGKNIGGSSVIGAAYTPGVYLNGRIRNFRLWSRILTAAEKNAPEARLTGREPGLLYYAPMDDGLNADPVLPQTVFPPSSFDAANPNVAGFVSNPYGCRLPPATLTYPLSYGGWHRLEQPSAGKYFATTIANAYGGAGQATWTTTSINDVSGIISIKFGNTSTAGAFTANQLNPTTFSAANWLHLITVLNSSSSVSVYANGVLHQTFKPTNSCVLPTNLDVKYILSQYAGVTNGQGYARNLGVWNKALTLAEIQADMVGFTPAPTTDLLTYLPLNESSGNLTYNLVASAGNASINEAFRVSLTPKTVDPVSFVSYPAFAGRYGAARTLLSDGSNDSIAATVPVLQYPFTLGGWIRLPSTAANNVDSRITIASSSNTVVAYIVMARHDSESTLYYTFVSGSGVRRVTSAPLYSPVHVMVVYRSDTDRSYYVNGRLLADDSLSYGVTSGGGNTLGINYRGSSSILYSAGYAWDVGYWNGTALTQAQIQQQMYMNSPVVPATCFFPMDEGTGNPVDVSGNNVPCVSTGATWSTLPNSNGSITGTSQAWQRTLINAFPPSFRSFLVTP